MTIEHENWLYINTSSYSRAKNFFGRPQDTEVKKRNSNLYAIRLKAPRNASQDQEFGLLQRFLRCQS